MNAPELRIRNIVDYFSEAEDRWYYGNQLSANDMICLLSEIGCEWKPIPLTEEWLLKLGFQNKGLFTNKIALSGHPSGDMDGSIIFRIGEYGQDIYLFENEFYFELASHTDDYGEEITTKKIQFLHQLQNLYFDLTGTELK